MIAVGRGAWSSGRHRPTVRGPGVGPRDVLSAAGGPPPVRRPAGAAPVPPGPDSGGSRRCLGPLHEDRFVDLPPAQVWAQVLDAGRVPPCSIRTMYRCSLPTRGAASAAISSGTRRTTSPELLAIGPQPGLELGHHQAPGAGHVDYYYLYVLLISSAATSSAGSWLGRIPRPGQGADHGRAGEAAAHRSRSAHHSCGPRPRRMTSSRWPCSSSGT